MWRKCKRAGCRSKSGYHLTLQTVLKGGQNEISWGLGKRSFTDGIKLPEKREEFKGAASDNHMERSSKSLIMTQRQVKTTRYQGTTNRMAKIKTFKAVRMQKRWIIRPCWWECGWNRYSRKLFAVLYKTKHAVTTQSSHCTPGYLS